MIFPRSAGVPALALALLQGVAASAHAAAIPSGSFLFLDLWTNRLLATSQSGTKLAQIQVASPLAGNAGGNPTLYPLATAVLPGIVTPDGRYYLTPANRQAGVPQLIVTDLTTQKVVARIGIPGPGQSGCRIADQDFFQLQTPIAAGTGSSRGYDLALMWQCPGETSSCTRSYYGHYRYASGRVIYSGTRLFLSTSTNATDAFGDPLPNTCKGPKGITGSDPYQPAGIFYAASHFYIAAQSSNGLRNDTNAGRSALFRVDGKKLKTIRAVPYSVERNCQKFLLNKVAAGNTVRFSGICMTGGDVASQLVLLTDGAPSQKEYVSLTATNVEDGYYDSIDTLAGTKTVFAVIHDGNSGQGANSVYRLDLQSAAVPNGTKTALFELPSINYGQIKIVP